MLACWTDAVSLLELQKLIVSVLIDKPDRESRLYWTIMMIEIESICLPTPELPVQTLVSQQRWERSQYVLCNSHGDDSKSID